MIKLILTIVFHFTFFGIYLSLGQAPSIQFAKSYGGSAGDYAQCVHQTTDGGYIVTGRTTSNDSDVNGLHSIGNNDFWVIKTDSIGTLQWQKCYGGSVGESAQSIEQTVDGGYIIAGNSTSNDGDVSGNHGADMWVVKTDSGGTIQWQKCLGGSAGEWGYDIHQTRDSGYIVIGEAASADGDVTNYHGGVDYWLVKLNNTGSLQWEKTYGGGSTDRAYSVMQTFDDGYIGVGWTASNDGDVTGYHGGSTDIWIIKTSSTGTLEWEKCFGSTGADYCYSIIQTPDSGYVFAGQPGANDGDVSTLHSNVSDYWLVKLGTTGIIQWEKCIGGTSIDNAYSLKQTDSGYIIAGISSSTDGDVTGNHGADYWIVKTDNSGNLLWQKCLGGSNGETARSVEETRDGGYIVAGYARSNDGDVTDHRGIVGVEDFWLVKLAPLGLMLQEQKEIAFTIYPSPVQENLQLILGNGQNGTLRIINLIGEEVLQTKTEAASTTIDIKPLAPGMYFVTLQTKEGIGTRKFVKE